MFLFNLLLIELLKLLSSGLTKEERMNELKSIALDTVDIRGIGFYSLRSHIGKVHLKNKKMNMKKYSLNIFYKVFQVDWLSILIQL